jgi:hypothetical protein
MKVPVAPVALEDRTDVVTGESMIHDEGSLNGCSRVENAEEPRIPVDTQLSSLSFWSSILLPCTSANSDLNIGYHDYLGVKSVPSASIRSKVMQRSAEKLPAATPAGIFQSGQKVEARVGAAGNLRIMAPEQPFLKAMKGFYAVIGSHNVVVDADYNNRADI